MTEPASQLEPALGWRRVAIAAWIALALHALAGLAMLLLLGDGLETNPDAAARFRYIAEHRAAWTIGWLLWHGASLSILAFILVVSRATAEYRASLAGRLAVVLVVAALAIDLAGQSLLIGFVPAASEGVSTVTMAVVQRISVLLSGYAANGLYTLATALIVAMMWRATSMVVRGAGALIVVAGVGLSAAALLGSADGMYWTNVALVPAILAWLAGVAWTAGRLARAAPP